jgi:1,2-diacylglycerol 3-alpha-glucosyltransferase
MTNVYKILTVTPSFPPYIGGIASHVLNLDVELAKQGNEVSVISPKKINEKIDTVNGILKKEWRIDSVYLLGWPYSPLKSISIPLDLGIKLQTIIRKGNFDVIHVHGHYYPISWFAINLAYKYGIPSILTIHEMYGLNPNAIGEKTWFENCYNKFVFKKMLSKSTGVIGLTDEITKFAKRFGKESVKYFTIPNGVHTNLFKNNIKRKYEYRRKYGIGEDKIVILFCGRFEKIKGIVEFAHATRNLVKNGQVEIVVVGKGSLESVVTPILRNTDRIHLFGWQPASSIHELYIASDIFVIPSKFEALPLSIIEAMNAGLYIVYSPVGGIPDILKSYPIKTKLTQVTSDEIEKTLTNLILNFSTYETQDALTYAQKFDWKDIALKTSETYLECVCG